MMKTNDLTASVRTRLLDAGIPDEVAERITARADLEAGAGGKTRETIEMAYVGMRKGKQRTITVAISNVPEDGIDAMLDNPGKIATFLDAGMRATPATNRIALPDWVLQNSRAAANENSMARASKLAATEATEAHASNADGKVPFAV